MGERNVSHSLIKNTFLSYLCTHLHIRSSTSHISLIYVSSVWSFIVEYNVVSFQFSKKVFTISHRSCINDPGHFCYICGKYTLPKQRRNITDFVKKSYLPYFGIKLGDQSKAWAPHKVCRVCIEELRHWVNGKRQSLSFGIPMVWREQSNHSRPNDCYFCSCDVKGCNSKNKK